MVVSKRLAALDVRKAAGNNSIPTKLLKTVANEIAHCLCYLFDLSLTTAQFPDEWKEATKTLVFKKRGAACLSADELPAHLFAELNGESSGSSRIRAAVQTC